VLVIGDSVLAPDDPRTEEAGGRVVVFSGVTRAFDRERLREESLFAAGRELDSLDFRSEPFARLLAVSREAVPVDDWAGRPVEIGFFPLGAAREDFLAAALARGTAGPEG